MNINISIVNKRPTVIGTPIIVCGNTGYVVEFAFDDEWNAYPAKTARFVYYKAGSMKYEDVLFEGNAVNVPLLSDIREVYVGVYAGDLRTTTPVRIPCDKSILCGGGAHEEPPEDVYNQLMALLEKMSGENVDEIIDAVMTSEEMTQVLADIADLKYVPIDVTKISNNVNTKELGSEVAEVTVSWALNKNPASQTLDGEAVDVAVRSKAVPGPFTAGKTFTLAVVDERDATASATTSISFLNGVYSGVLEDGAAIDSAAIRALTRKLQSTKALTFTVDAGATQRIVYALPTRYGTPNFNVGGFDGGFAKAATIDFTNASGYTEQYDVWLSENTGLGNTTVKVT